MEPQCGLKIGDAFSKSLEITKRDAERFPEEKANIFSSRHMCALSDSYYTFDPEVCFNRMFSLESNHKRLRSEMTFIIKIWLLEYADISLKKVHLGDKMRLMTLSRKYSINIQYRKMNLEFFAFPDICCNLFVKYPNSLLLSLEDYKNFKNQYKFAGYFGMLPSGMKYGGFVKALAHFYFVNYRLSSSYMFHSDGFVIYHCLAQLRILYNATIVSQEKRLEFFKKLSIKESDCILWSQTFDRTFPEYAYIHKLFGQVA